MRTAYKDLKTWIGTLLMLVAAAGFSQVHAQMNEDYRPFRDWDVNNNYKLTLSEFYEGATQAEIYESWDDDNSGYLSEGELRSGIYKKWEHIGQEFAGQDEARAEAFTHYYSGTFDDWDLNGDGTITNKEYNEKIGKDKGLNIEKRMDLNGDGQYDKNEFYTAIFKMWDQDASGYLSDEEFDPDQFTSWFL